MKALFAIVACALLSACATPRPIVDTASLVAKMSNDMDRSVTSYVGSLKTARALDAQRLQRLQAEVDLRKRAIQEELQTLKLAEETRPLKAMTDLGTMLESSTNPMRQAAGEPAVVAKPITFDSAPLKSVASIAGEIAKPLSASEQFAVLFAFASTVNDDLKKAEEANKKVRP